jgi:hexosaminidase
MFLWLLSLACLSPLLAQSIWPLPNVFEVTSQGTTRNIAPLLKYSTLNSENKEIEINTLTRLYSRYNNLIFSRATDHNGRNKDAIYSVKVVVVDTSEDYPKFDTDESYSIAIDTEVTIKAQTIYGVIRAVESLSQLIEFNVIEKKYEVLNVPIKVEDAPRFNHRGFLLDTSRHYHSVATLKKLLDSMAYNKLNVFHWHIVDTQSFAFESTRYPTLWNGAYTKAERYSKEDMIDLVEYGRDRGIKIMIEFDVPGHAASWCVGIPEICPSTSCLQPLDPSTNKTFEVIDGLMAECTDEVSGNSLFPYEFIHLGGDEVDTTCWTRTPHIDKWMVENSLNASTTYKYFVEKAGQLALEHKKSPVQWVEVFENFGSALDKNIVIHVWKDPEIINDIVSAGYKTIASSYDYWYLDHLELTWETFYSYEPTKFILDSSNNQYLIGGEVCMWSETVDDSDLFATVYPRTSAGAERMWTNIDIVANNDMDDVLERLEVFKCLMLERGIGAAPVTNKIGRFQPREPGSCYVQRR